MYVVAYVPLYHFMGTSAGMFATFPVLAAAWSFGPYGGGLAGLLTLPLNAFLTQISGQELGAWAVDGGVLGSFSEVMVGSLVGYVRRLQLEGLSLLEEKSQVEQALRTSQERLEMAAEAANEGMWDWPDMSQDAQWWSLRMYELLGYVDREVEASFSNFKAFLHPDDSDRVAEAVSRHLEQRMPFEMVYRLQTKSGDYCWFQGRGRSRTDHNRKAVCMSGSIRDITQEKQAENQQRTLDARLREVEKLESLGVFARGFAHDFNNLLTSVMGNASFALLTLPPTSPLRSNMEAIEQAASHGEELAQQLLAYAGEGRGLPTHLDLSAFIEATAPLLAAAVPQRVVIDYRLPRGLPPIVADPTQMRRVLVNLVANAAHAIGAADGVITLRTGTVGVNDRDCATDRPGQAPLSGVCTYIEVSDMGVGIDEDIQAKMWDPFFSTRPLGRGLGLAVVQGVVRSHGGRIKVTSQSGAGAAIQIEFPAAQVPEQPAAAAGRVRAEGQGLYADRNRNGKGSATEIAVAAESATVDVFPSRDRELDSRSS